jgi:hypothetical protein
VVFLVSTPCSLSDRTCSLQHHSTAIFRDTILISLLNSRRHSSWYIRGTKVQTAFQGHPVSYSKDYDALSAVINLATRLHLRLRMNGGISPGLHIPHDRYRDLYLFFTYRTKSTESRPRRMSYVMKFVPRHFDKRIY